MFRWFSHLQTQLNPASVIFSRTVLYWWVCSGSRGICWMSQKSCPYLYIMLLKLDKTSWAHIHSSPRFRFLYTFFKNYTFLLLLWFFPLSVHFLPYILSKIYTPGFIRKKSLSDNTHVVFHSLRCSIILIVIFFLWFHAEIRSRLKNGMFYENLFSLLLYDIIVGTILQFYVNKVSRQMMVNISKQITISRINNNKVNLIHLKCTF